MWFDAYPGGPLFYLQLLYFQKKGKTQLSTSFRERHGYTPSLECLVRSAGFALESPSETAASATRRH